MSQSVPAEVKSQPITEGSCPLVSAIVPVLNDARRLELCLSALDEQSYPADAYEVIVVDNGSDDEDAIARVVSSHRARLSWEKKPGSYCARNHGLSLARGEIIAFTDADCIPDRDWLEQGVSCLQSVPKCGLVAGRVELFYRDPQHLTAVELHESIYAFPQEAYLAQGLGGVTANLLTYKAVVDRVGGFKESLKSGGDLEWGERVASLGYERVYSARVKVRHPARACWGEIARKARRTTGGIYDRFMDKQAPPLEMHLTFGRLIYDNLRQIPKDAFAVWGNSRLPGWRDKMKVTAVVCYIRIVELVEKFRLRWGGSSSRS